MKGASASRASRLAISVLPTPVGPIIRMFFGRISRAISGSSCWRRQRLRRATATAFLARFLPMMNLSSSATISRGVSDPGALFAVSSAAFSPGIRKTMSELFQRDAVVGVDVDGRGDRQGLARDLGRGELRAVLQEGARGRERVRAAGADREDSLLGRDQVAGPRDQERGC